MPLQSISTHTTIIQPNNPSIATQNTIHKEKYLITLTQTQKERLGFRERKREMRVPESEARPRERDELCRWRRSAKRETSYAAWRRSSVFFFIRRVGFFLGGVGKMVYEIKKGKPFSKKCEGFLVKWKSFSVWPLFYVEVNTVKCENYFLETILRRSKRSIRHACVFNWEN
jgi:hypothetical protein